LLEENYIQGLIVIQTLQTMTKPEADAEVMIEAQKNHPEKPIISAYMGGKFSKRGIYMLEQNNIPMAICSGALLTEVEMVLEDARLRHLFEVIVSGEQVTKGKPDPEGFLLSLQRLNESRANPITANQCIVIEDSHWGLEAAKAAGMHTIAVTNSYGAEHLSMAEKIVNQLNELSIDDLQKLCS